MCDLRNTQVKLVICLIAEMPKGTQLAPPLDFAKRRYTHRMEAMARVKTAVAEQARQAPLAGLSPELAARVGRLIEQLPAEFGWPRIIWRLPPRQRAVAMCVVGRLALSRAGAEPLSARALASELGVSHTLVRRVFRRLVGAKVVADVTELMDPRLDREHQGRARLFVLRWNPSKYAEVETPHTPRRSRAKTPASPGTQRRPEPQPGKGRAAARAMAGNRWVLWHLKADLRTLPKLHRDAIATALHWLQARGELDPEACARLVRNLPFLLARRRPSERNPRRVYGWGAQVIHRALALPRLQPRPATLRSGGTSRRSCRGQPTSQNAPAVTVRLPVEGAPGYLGIELAPARGTLAVARLYFAHCPSLGTSNLNLPEVRLEERWAEGRRVGVWAVWPGGELPLRRIPLRELQGYVFDALSPLNPGDRRLRIRVWIQKDGTLSLEWWRGRGQHHHEFARSATFKVGDGEITTQRRNGGRRRVKLLPPKRQQRERICCR